MHEVPKYNVDSEVADIRANRSSSARSSREEHHVHMKIEEETSLEKRGIMTQQMPRVIPRIQSYEKKKIFPVREITVFFVLASVLTGGIWIMRRSHVYEEAYSVSKEENTAYDSIATSFRSWWRFLKSGSEAYLEFQNSAGEAFHIARLAEQLSADAPFLMLSGKGDEVRARLSELALGVAGLLDAHGNIPEKLQILDEPFDNAHGGSSSGEYFSLSVALREWKDLLNAITAWLDAEAPHHIIVLFENPSEIRPAGGFVGSFAHAVIQKGNIISITTHDINEVDRTRDARIIPPEPLRRIAEEWTTADANWFFDFPRSAEKVLGFMEKSGFFRKEGVRFDGAIAITGRPIEDILAVTGPLTLEDGTRITGENVIMALQREVQGRRSAGDDAPKQVIDEFAEILIDKLKTFPEEKRDGVIRRVGEWVQEKDLMVYMRKGEFREALARYGFDGSTYTIPSSFAGDYLAVVAANIEGAKTDLFMEQRVALESRIGTDGSVEDQLTVTRIHKGNNASEWWYRVPNQAYFMVHVPHGARLTATQGGMLVKIPSIEKYEREGYVRDTDVVALETDTQGLLSFPSVKFLDGDAAQIFATWMRVDRGAKSVVTLEYARRLPELPADGSEYVFVLETQAGIPSRRGVESPYTITLHAPLGFVWRENSLPTYEWKSDDPPGRVVIELTFKKL